jgi:hypothetical protein
VGIFVSISLISDRFNAIATILNHQDEDHKRLYKSLLTPGIHHWIHAGWRS